jgi:hypothetical protein
VSEGEFDRELLSFLIGKKFGPQSGSIQVLASRGKSNAVSLARSLLAVRGEPVALVVDSDTTDRGQADSLRNDLQAELAQMAPSALFHIFLAEPEIEAWLFSDPSYLERVLGGPLDHSLVPLAEVRPKEALNRWFQAKKRGPLTLGKLMAMVKQQDPTPVLRHPTVDGLMRFLAERIRPQT